MPSPDLLPDLGPDFPALLARAHDGCGESAGRLLDTCRTYLLLVANREIDPALRAKVGASDLVQDTFVKATAQLEQFEGRTADELLAWLRRILLNHLTDVSRAYHQSDKRRLGLEVSLNADPGGRRLRGRLAAPDETPGQEASVREDTAAVESALARLSEPHREVLLLHNRDGLPFPEIGARLGKSADAVRKQWARAVEAVGRMLENGHDAP